MLEYLENKTVLVTGAAGTIGSALSEQLAGRTRSLRCFDHAESDLFYLHERIRHKGHVAPQLGDIRDRDRLRFALHGVDVVFHTAALKHVGLGEYNPFEVVQSNLVGLDNVIRAALDANVDRMVFTSSDKAVNPTNVMGASKMMGERLVTAANEIRGTRRTRFAAVRFGNVIGSRGSVVPIFHRALMRGEPLPVTDEGMTRYVMSIHEAARLVIEAGSRIHAGEVYVTKMRALRIVDLAHAMADVVGKTAQLRITGARPGEKLYEELLSEDEMSRAVDLERLLVVLPVGDAAEAGPYRDAPRVRKHWSSANDELMSRGEIASYLREHRVIDALLEG